MNLFSAWKAENTNNRLGFGIHDNVVIKKVDTEPRKKQDGSIMKVAMFITYTQVSPEGNPLAEIEEFVFWPKHDGKDVLKSVFSYMNRFYDILSCHYEPEQVKKVLGSVLSFESNDMLLKSVSTPKGMKEIITAINHMFVESVIPISGLKSDKRFRLKVTYQEDGRGLEIPLNSFIESMSVPLEQTTLVMNQRDVRAKLEAEKPKAATDLRAGVGIPSIPGAPSAPASLPGMNTLSAPSAVPGAVQVNMAPVMSPSIPPNTEPQPEQVTVSMPFLGNQ